MAQKQKFQSQNPHEPITEWGKNPFSVTGLGSIIRGEKRSCKSNILGVSTESPGNERSGKWVGGVKKMTDMCLSLFP